MADIEHMTGLPGTFGRAIEGSVEAGEYASTSEAILDAVRVCGGRRELRQREVEMLRRAWDKRESHGPAGILKIADVIAEAKAERALKG